LRQVASIVLQDEREGLAIGREAEVESDLLPVFGLNGGRGFDFRNGRRLRHGWGRGRQCASQQSGKE